MVEHLLKVQFYSLQGTLIVCFLIGKDRRSGGETFWEYASIPLIGVTTLFYMFHIVFFSLHTFRKACETWKNFLFYLYNPEELPICSIESNWNDYEKVYFFFLSFFYFFADMVIRRIVVFMTRVS